MIPVKQTGDDCWAAATASILELQMDQVPPSSLAINWAPAWHRFLLKRNLFQLTVPIDHTRKFVPPGWSVLCCRTTDAHPCKFDWQLHCIV